MSSDSHCLTELDEFVCSFEQMLFKIGRNDLQPLLTGAVQLLDEQNKPCFSISFDPTHGPTDVQFTTAMEAKAFFQRYPVLGYCFVRVNNLITKKFPLFNPSVMANVYQLVYKPLKK